MRYREECFAVYWAEQRAAMNLLGLSIPSRGAVDKTYTFMVD